MNKIFIFGITALVILAVLFGYLGYSSNVKRRNYLQFRASVNALIGLPETDATNKMQSLGMHLRSKVKDKEEWRRAVDHVSPMPKMRPDEYALKYTDDAALTRKCVFLYIKEDQRVSAIHFANEFW